MATGLLRSRQPKVLPHLPYLFPCCAPVVSKPQINNAISIARSVIRPKNIKLVVVVVQSSLHGSFLPIICFSILQINLPGLVWLTLFRLVVEEISEDRLLALRKRAELDSKYVLFVNFSIDSELTHSLSRHVSILFSCFLLCTKNKRSHRNVFAESLLHLQSWRFRITEKKEGESKVELRKGAPTLLISMFATVSK